MTTARDNVKSTEEVEECHDACEDMLGDCQKHGQVLDVKIVKSQEEGGTVRRCDCHLSYDEEEFTPEKL